MSLLPFGNLPPHKPRRFVPPQLDLGNWGQIAPLFDQLEARAPQCATVNNLEYWLMDWSELNAALDEEGSRRYIGMSCHTDDPEAEKAYLHFVEHVEPQTKPRKFNLANLYVSHPLRLKLDQHRFEVFDRDTRVQVELFRPENVPLETEEAKLSQEYQKLMGSLTVQFRGEEKTLVQMGRYLEEPDRALRQEAWELVANRRLAEVDKFEAIFDELRELGLLHEFFQILLRERGPRRLLVFPFAGLDFQAGVARRAEQGLTRERPPVVQLKSVRAGQQPAKPHSEANENNFTHGLNFLTDGPRQRKRISTNFNQILDPPVGPGCLQRIRRRAMTPHAVTDGLERVRLQRGLREQSGQ
jgi:hypothetical protein